MISKLKNGGFKMHKIMLTVIKNMTNMRMEIPKKDEKPGTTDKHMVLLLNNFKRIDPSSESLFEDIIDTINNNKKEEIKIASIR